VPFAEDAKSKPAGGWHGCVGNEAHGLVQEGAVTTGCLTVFLLLSLQVNHTS
jgi:hypothetical protein